MADFWDCSLWDFAANIDGWNEGQSREETPEPMTGQRYDELKKKYGYT